MTTSKDLAYYQQLVDDLLTNPPDYPQDRFDGKGIVICGGGVEYFACTWVCINMLRQVGCTLPIELWYLGPQEMSEEMKAMVIPFGVKCIDAFEVTKVHPIENLIGWELKPYAILHSGFEEILYLDADNVPVRDPSFLFDHPIYLGTGSVFWPDRYQGGGVGDPWLRREAWSVCQIPFRDEAEFETGQLIVDKRKCWYPLVLTLHYNEHSEFYYEFFYGDKDTFHLAWRKLRQEYFIIPHANKILGQDSAIIQHDFDGKPLFQHRNGDKWSIHRNNFIIPDFQFENECFAYLKQLQSIWNGMPRKVPDDFYPSEKSAFAELVSTKTYECTVEGLGTWWLELLWDFRVIEPEGMDKSWMVKDNNQKGAILIIKINNRFGHTCRLWPKENGVWRGRWMTKDRRAIELRPKLPPVTHDHIVKYQNLQDEFISNLPPNPEHKYKGSGIVMVGGGAKYFPCAWVLINVLRRLLGCQLPIELWHLGPQEVDDSLKRIVFPFDVECIDAFEVSKKHPVRILKGWQLKPYSIIHSKFEEVIFIDVDNVPLTDPAFLLESEQYERTGSVFWPDYGNLGSFRNIWKICGITFRNEPEFETGQIVINKTKNWLPLQLTMHYNEHSDYYYNYVNGDKETFHMAWNKLEVPYSMTDYALSPLENTMCQYDFDGNIIFQHRNGDKWRMDGRNKRISGFQYEEECFGFLNELHVLCTKN